ncbi:MAG: biosynthetic arginine decarboxylase [Oceanococcus sp.]
MRGTQFNSSDAERLYNIDHWSAGYFSVNSAGELCVRAGDQLVALSQILDSSEADSLRSPCLLRFSHILRDRVVQLQGAFDSAIAEQNYSGRYTPVYPIKVNQQADVVRELLAGGNIGLEAGSKPELLAVLGLLPVGRPIVCNGYKDLEYIRLGLIGQNLGHRVTLVLEKLSEIEHIVTASTEQNTRPHLGLRVRLASIGAGHWQNTGGEKSKFGLSAQQIDLAIAKLKRDGLLDCLHLLHFHLGSQVANLRDIRRGLREAARYFVELRKMGAPIDCIDVGGGLGVDYEGTRSRSYCSMNYSMADYAQAVVETFAEAAQEAGLECPDIISESGRALTAHHAVLVTHVIDAERADDMPANAPTEHAPAALKQLWALLEDDGYMPPLESLAEADALLEQLLNAFHLGETDLQQRAQAENLHRHIARQILPRLDPSVRAHRDTLDHLRERFADKLFCNFSIFQSAPDIWAIDQVFPIVPLSRLNERPDRRAVIRDLTCDSDGRIDHYVDRDGIDSSLPVHTPQEGEIYRFGLFMVGAYQEILGDMHNLFGDTDAVNVNIQNDGQWSLSAIEQGDRVDEILAYVHLCSDELLSNYQRKINQSALSPDAQQAALNTLKQGLSGYTYLV